MNGDTLEDVLSLVLTHFEDQEQQMCRDSSVSTVRVRYLAGARTCRLEKTA